MLPSSISEEQLVLHNKSSEVCIKTRSTPASLPCKSQVTERTTVKWRIQLNEFEKNARITSTGIFEERASSSLGSFHVGPRSCTNWKLYMKLVFFGGGGGKLEYPGRSKAGTNNNSAHIWHGNRAESNPGPR